MLHHVSPTNCSRSLCEQTVRKAAKFSIPMVQPEFLLATVDAGALADPVAFVPAGNKRHLAAQAAGSASVEADGARGSEALEAASDDQSSSGLGELATAPAAAAVQAAEPSRHAWREERARARASRRITTATVAAEASSPGATAATPVGDDIEMEVFGVRGVLQRGRRGRPPEEVEVFGVRGVLCDSRGPAEAGI